MIFNYPQIILASWVFLTVSIHIFKNNTVKPKGNFYATGALFLLEVFMLAKGGFFLTGFKWPQIAWGVLSSLGLLSSASAHSSLSLRDRKFHGPFAVIGGTITFAIYYFGGFFG